MVDVAATESLKMCVQDRARAKQARQTFLDTSKVQEAGRFQHAIPESLRPKMGHLSVPQQRVYEDFARIPRNPMAAAKQVDQVRTSNFCQSSPRLMNHIEYFLLSCGCRIAALGAGLLAHGLQTQLALTKPAETGI